MAKIILVLITLFSINAHSIEYVIGLHTKHLGATSYTLEGERIALNEKNGFVAIQAHGLGLARFTNSYNLRSTMLYKTHDLQVKQWGKMTASVSLSWGLIDGYPDSAIVGKFNPLLSPSIKLDFKRGFLNLGLYGAGFDVLTLSAGIDL